jgi:hypothetical protein
MRALLTADNLARISEVVTTVKPTEQPREFVEYPPLEQPESLIIEMDESLVKDLNRIEGNDRFISYEGKAERVINSMGVSNYPDLVEQYRTFFDSQWGIAPFFEQARADIRGLGSEPFSYDQGRSSWQEIGFFYGLVDIGPGYMILQTKPDSNLNPVDNPEAFISIRLARPYAESVGDRNYALLGVRTINEHGRLVQLYPTKKGMGDSSMEMWNVEELMSYFDLKRGSIITTSNGQASSPGEYTPRFIYVQMNELPTDREQHTNGYSLRSTGGW